MRNTPYIIWWAVGVHIVWGAGLIANADVASIAILAGVDAFLKLGASPDAFGSFMIAAAILAGLALLAEGIFGLRRFPTLVLLIPQYTILIVALVTDLAVLGAGSVNGRDVNRWVLAVVLVPFAWAAVLHSAAILDRYIFAEVDQT